MQAHGTPQFVITNETMQAAEQGAVEGGIPLQQLMENAGKAVADEVMRRYSPRPTLVLCGPGNNGGDGFVAAKHLLAAGWPVRVMSTVDSLEAYKSPALEAAQDYPGEIDAFSPYGLENAELIIDGLFGTGLSKPVIGELGTLIDIINDLGVPVVSIDIPSGVQGNSGKVEGVAVNADLTVTFGCARVGHVLLPGVLHAGHVVVADIGIPGKLFLGDRITANAPRNWLHHLKEPTPYDNKFTRGACAILGLSEMTGAPKLATQASRRSGAGLSVIACSPESYPIYGASAMGEIVSTISSFKDLKKLFEDRRVKCVLAGPGMLPNAQTREMMLRLLADKIPLVMDAGAISAFAENPGQLLKSLHDQVILTPHEGEFTRLFPELGPEFLNKIERTRKASEIAGCTILLKGYDTVICNHQGDCVVNTNASPNLATAGSGDVLAGIITGIRAHVTSPFIATQIGAWMHGEAAQGLGEGMIAEDIIAELPRVWSLLRSKTSVAI